MILHTTLKKLVPGRKRFQHLRIFDCSPVCVGLWIGPKTQRHLNMPVIFTSASFRIFVTFPFSRQRKCPKMKKRPNTTIDPAGGIKYLTLDEKKIPENAGPAALAIDPPTIERPCIVPL
mmetsp:Transcript_7693/g.19155  ORF Transcript_7693/g.19155 Transcript_7693/m.19155 type:complete len:119 (-) Transcript_7693:1473-1829(-)